MPNKVKTIGNTNLYKNLTVFKIPIQTSLPDSRQEARRRVINLYKAWYRQLPAVCHDYVVKISGDEARSILRENFVKNANLTNLGQIHKLVLQGQMDLNELTAIHKEPCHFLKYFRTAHDKKPNDFLSKFLEGN